MTRVRFGEIPGVQSSNRERVQAQGLAAVAGDRQCLRAARLAYRQAAKGQRGCTQESDWSNNGLRARRLAENSGWAEGARSKDRARNPCLRVDLVHLVCVDEGSGGIYSPPDRQRKARGQWRAGELLQKRRREDMHSVGIAQSMIERHVKELT